MPSTGYVVLQPATYKSDCTHDMEVELSRGDRFPPCDDCRRRTNWTLAAIKTSTVRE
jgi:hypothetical protein